MAYTYNTTNLTENKIACHNSFFVKRFYLIMSDFDHYLITKNESCQRSVGGALSCWRSMGMPSLLEGRGKGITMTCVSQEVKYFKQELYIITCLFLYWPEYVPCKHVFASLPFMTVFLDNYHTYNNNNNNLYFTRVVHSR